MLRLLRVDAATGSSAFETVDREDVLGPVDRGARAYREELRSAIAEGLS